MSCRYLIEEYNECSCGNEEFRKQYGCESCGAYSEKEPEADDVIIDGIARKQYKLPMEG